MKMYAVLSGLLGAFLVSAFPVVASATDPCWWELTYYKVPPQPNGQNWVITRSSFGIGCAGLQTYVYASNVCLPLAQQAEQREGEIHCCWRDQSTSPHTIGMEPGWCRWPNG